MRLENAVAADVLERILSAYGFTMQKELSDKLGIAKSNVASWLQRGQVPGNVLVQCALDTGADIQWLVTGVFANANLAMPSEIVRQSLLDGQFLLKKMLQSGGKPVLQRIMDAYGHKTQKELSAHLNISTATISTWVRREFFPGEVVIACALETGRSLVWLALGEIDASRNDGVSNNCIVAIDRFMLHSGVLTKVDSVCFDEKLFDFSLESVSYVETSKDSYIVDFNTRESTNGTWLIDVDGNVDIYEILKIPGNKISASTNGKGFTCMSSDVIYIGLVKKVIHNCD